MPRRPKLRVPLFVLAASLAMVGCGPAIRQASTEAPKAAVPVAIDASLDKVEEQRTRERIAAILATPEMQQAIREFGADLGDGLIDGISDARTDERLTRLTTVLTRAVLAAMTTELDRVRPATAAIVRSSVDAALAEMTSPKSEEAMTRLASALVKGMGPALAETLRTPEMQSAMGELGHNVAREAVMGSNQAMAELVRQEKKNEGGGPIGSALSFASQQSWVIALASALIVLGIPLVWLLRDRAEARRYREETEARNARAAALVELLDAAKDQPWSVEFGELLKDRIRDASRPPPPPPRKPSRFPRLHSRHA